MAVEGLTDALARFVGRPHVLVDADLRAGYEVDWTRRFQGSAAAVVRPGSTDEVAALLSWCAREGVPVVPQGGNTGLVGGGVPDDSGASVVLSTTRLTQVGVVDVGAAQVTAQAGVALSRLDAATQGSGWEFGVDLGARDQATIGGMVATNAGGTRVLRYGSMRANLVGVEAVLGDGSVVAHLDGLVKDNTGYDLAGLLCGSEGTLGVVTAARLRLVPRWPDRAAVWMACDGWEHAVALASRLRANVDGLDAVEAVDNPCWSLARDVLGLPPVLADPPPVAVLAVWAGRGEPPAALVEVASETEHAVALDPVRFDTFWAVRDRMAEAIARVGVPHKFDVTLPLARLAAFTGAVQTLAESQAEGARLFLFGHLGDGNLHVNVVGAPEDLDAAMFTLVAEHGGSISAEHGIGRHKAHWLHLNRSPAERAAFAGLKHALDPAGIMNPGVLLAQYGH